VTLNYRRRPGLHPDQIGDDLAIVRATARELIGLYRGMLNRGGVPDYELDHAREAAQRWCRRAGLDFQTEVCRRPEP